MLSSQHMDIIATIWKKPYKHQLNQSMIDAGVNTLRIKCSHLSTDELSEALQNARKQINEQERHISLLADLPEAKIRIGTFPQEKVDVSEGEEFRFILGPASSDPAAYIPFTSELLGQNIQKEDYFYLGDGLVKFVVTQIHAKNEFVAVAKNNGTLIAKSSITVPRIADQLNHVTQEIHDIIPHLSKSQPDYIAFSFISSRRMFEALKNEVNPYLTSTWQPKFIAKIESSEGVHNIDEILSVADGIMIARGDLALNTPFEELGLIQKTLTAKARRAKKYCIVSTGALQSMLYTNIPHRADILDVTNITLDGASAIMLCTETAHHPHPEHVIKTAKKIIDRVQHL